MLSKFYGLVFFALTSTLFVYIMSTVLGLVYSREDMMEYYWNETLLLPAYFIKHVCFLSIFMFVGFLVKKSAISLGVVFVWFVLEFVGIQMTHFKYDMPELASQLREIMPLHSPYFLTPEPISRFETMQRAGEALGSTVEAYNLPSFKNFAVSIGWTIIFALGSLGLLRKRDL